MRTISIVVVSVALAASSAAFAGAPVYIPPPTRPSSDAPSKATETKSATKSEPAPQPAQPTSSPHPAPAVADSKAKTEKAAKRWRLLVLDMKGNDVDDATVQTLQGFITTGLAYYPELDVVSGEDVKQLVQLQAERDTMGCSEDASCLAEIADALGAQLVVFGNIGKLSDALVVNLNLFDSVKAQGLGRIVVQADDVKSLPAKLRPKLHDLVGKFYKDKGLTQPPLVEEKDPAAVAQQPWDPGPWPWITATTGFVMVAGGTAAAVVGYLPFLAFEEHKARVESLESNFVDSEDPALVEQALAAQSAMRKSRDEWNNLGVFLVDAGIPVAAVGFVAGAGGLVWALATSSPSEEDAAPGATPAAPGATTPAPTTAHVATGGAR